MNKYHDERGETVEVTHGLGDWWIVARGRHRVKTSALPPRKSAKECQRDLDAYATRKKWRRLLAVEVPSNGHEEGRA